MEAQSLVSHQHSWWFSCFSLREKLARSHKTKKLDVQLFSVPHVYVQLFYDFPQ